MDSSNVILQQLSLKRKFDDDASMDVSIKKARYCFDIYSRQNFSLPDSIIYYISKHPTSPKVYQKLIQSCKYFFVKNPILILSSLSEYSDETNKWKTRFGEFNLENIGSCKIWIADYFRVLCNTTNLVSSVVPKLYRCSAKHLFLKNQIISFNDYIFLASDVEEDIYILRVTVKYKDGSIVPLEKLVEVATKVKEFCFEPNETFSDISSNTMKELSKVQHFSKFDFMSIENIPETFDLDAFYLHMKKNKKTNFYLVFNDSISVKYKNRLEAIVDEILEAKNNLDFYPPAISFPGLDVEKETKLDRLDEFYNKI